MTNARTTSISVIMARSEALGPQQRVGQVEQQAERDEAGERIIEHHGCAPLQAFAGIGVAYPRREEAEAKGQYDDIPHERSSLLRTFPGATSARFREDVLRWINRDRFTVPSLPGSVTVRCHPAHRFSRRSQW